MVASLCTTAELKIPANLRSDGEGFEGNHSWIWIEDVEEKSWFCLVDVGLSPSAEAVSDRRRAVAGDDVRFFVAGS